MSCPSKAKVTFRKPNEFLFPEQKAETGNRAKQSEGYTSWTQMGYDQRNKKAETGNRAKQSEGYASW